MTTQCHYRLSMSQAVFDVTTSGNGYRLPVGIRPLMDGDPYDCKNKLPQCQYITNIDPKPAKP